MAVPRQVLPLSIGGGVLWLLSLVMVSTTVDGDGGLDGGGSVAGTATAFAVSNMLFWSGFLAFAAAVALLVVTWVRAEAPEETPATDHYA